MGIVDDTAIGTVMTPIKLDTTVRIIASDTLPFATLVVATPVANVVGHDRNMPIPNAKSGEDDKMVEVKTGIDNIGVMKSIKSKPPKTAL